MRQVLVTGATGFIGQFCIKALQKRGFIVYALSTKPVASTVDNIIWCQADLHDYRAIKQLLARIRPTFLLHLAWYVEHGQYWSSEKNLQWVASSLNLVQEFTNNGGKRLICAGTCAEYDWSENVCSENLSELLTPLNPQTLYGACKSSLQATLGAWSKTTGLSFAWGRLFFPYGPGENRKRLIPSTVLSLLQGKTITCNNPELSRDFIFVDDVAQIFAALIDSDICGPINIASGQAIKLRQVVDLISRRLNIENLIEYKIDGAISNEPLVLCGNVSRLKDELNILPTTPLAVGIEKTINWWQENLNHENQDNWRPVLI